MSGRPFLVTTPLVRAESSSPEILLGPWCQAYRNGKAGVVQASVLPSPWDEAGQREYALRLFDSAYERLLAFLAESLNEAHGMRASLRYWRVAVGPWLLNFVTAYCDRFLHAQAALRRSRELSTAFLDRRDFLTVRDTWDYTTVLSTDRFNWQIYSEIFESLGIEAPARRLPPGAPPLPRRSAWKRAGWAAAETAASLHRRLLGCSTAFSDLYFERSSIARLMASTGFRVSPVLGVLPDHDKGLSPELRGLLSRFKATNAFEQALGRSLPGHVPSLFLEGFGRARAQVLSAWPRLPRALLTSVGWFYNEYFKLLAAESLEAGARLTICQHGGAYGMFEPLHNERHERLIADEYWTWGWSDESAGGARLKPMPHPRVSRRPVARRSTGDWVLAGHAAPRYPYSFYFMNMPVWHRYMDYIRGQHRFIAALPERARRTLQVRLPGEDFGWELRRRLKDLFPALSLDPGAIPWEKRLRGLKLVVVDNPQTTYLEALSANLPTVLFWDPALWQMRDSALPWLDELRQTGILHDDAEAAAAHVGRIFDNPWSWWSASAVQEARRRFCGRYAGGRPDWHKIWASEISRWQ
ncbi:MAG: hypothetical protein HY549_05380 [Elusimicrobia bacterium]|nr:hypothetical protein [Elusimicrobiota bacterium]